VAYVRLISKWGRVYNLTAVRDPADMLTQHIVDSLAIVGPLRRQTSGRPIRLLDVGSGAVCPGWLLASAARPASGLRRHGAKKAGFIRQWRWN
jgi:16S rRNA (guanine527-N7)-methyltransferase